jgi:hypothetical protein
VPEVAKLFEQLASTQGWFLIIISLCPVRRVQVLGEFEEIDSDNLWAAERSGVTRFRGQRRAFEHPHYLPGDVLTL